MLEGAPDASGGGELSESLKEIRDAYDQLSMNTDSQVINMYKKQVSSAVTMLEIGVDYFNV